MTGNATETAFLRGLPDVASPPRAVLRAVADGVAAATGSSYAPPTGWDAAAAGVDVPPDASPWLLGQAREVLHDSAVRSSLGAWFTPTAVARELVALAGAARPASVMDPSCGGGAFLIAAHERFPGATLHGMDIDPLAVETTRTALQLAGARDVDVQVTDGLTGPTPGRFDLVVGNPPFLSQLARSTARSPARRRELTDRFGALATRYVDEAALFVLRTARDLLTEGGVAVLVVPEAVLAAADAGAVRQAVGRLCTVDVVWRDTRRAFPGTPTCAIRLRRVTGPTPGGEEASWAHLLADEVPRVAVRPGRTVGDLATATADFREAYYLLADHVHEQTGTVQGPPIVPVGLIDPAHLRWGEADVRFAKQRWRRPVAVGLPKDFLDRRLGPKVLVATQTRVLEALVDADGGLLPSTPAITLRTDRPWHVAAALTSPVATAVAARRHAGAARTRGALKLSARQVLELPLPDEGEGWDAAADAIRQAHSTTEPEARRALVLRCGRLVDAAHGVDDPALRSWWEGRLPVR